MSRRLTPIAAAFAAVVVCAFVASQGAMGARSCAAFDGRVLVLSETGRIISVRRPGFSIWYACLERHGRRVALGDHIPAGAEQLSRPLLAGSFAAFKRYRPSTGTTGPIAVVVDLGARRRASMHVDDGITGMVLSDRGDLVVTSPASVLHLRRGRPVATLDVGDITPSSLALSRNGRDAYWLNRGQPRSFVLPAGRARAP